MCDNAAFVLADLHSHGVSAAVETLPSGATPTSYILRSAASGSRTIIHHRDIVELSFSAFQAATAPLLQSCAHSNTPAWLHTEGRNPHETAQMMQHFLQHNSHLPSGLSCPTPSRRCAQLSAGAGLPAQRIASVEIEKTRSQHGLNTAKDGVNHAGSELDLLPWAHVVFSCREYASQTAGEDPGQLCLQLLQASCTGEAHALYGLHLPEVVVTWGDKGAYAFVPSDGGTGSHGWGAAATSSAAAKLLVWGVQGDPDTLHWIDTACDSSSLHVAGCLVHIEAPLVPHVVDTVGAGDSFIAGVLVSLTSATQAPSDFLAAVKCGVQVASAKVAQEGMNGLKMPC